VPGKTSKLVAAPSIPYAKKSVEKRSCFAEKPLFFRQPPPDWVEFILLRLFLGKLILSVRIAHVFAMIPGHYCLGHNRLRANCAASRDGTVG
jgi:hypothetical protein